MNQTNFKQLDKEITNLLDDDYFFTRKIQLKTRNASGIDWSAGGNISQMGTQGYIAASFTNPTGFSLDTFRIKTDGRVLAEASLKFDESKVLTASIEDGRHEPGKAFRSYGKLGLSIYTKYLNVFGDIDIVNGPVLSSNTILKYDQFQLGGEVMLNTHLEEKDQKPEFVDINFGGSYHGPDWIASFKTSDLLNNLHIGYVHHTSPQVSVCGLLDYKMKSNHQSISVGVKYLPEENTAIKLKYNSDAICSGSIKQKVNNFLQFVACVEIDTKEMGADGHKFGLGLDFE